MWAGVQRAWAVLSERWSPDLTKISLGRAHIKDTHIEYDLPRATWDVITLLAPNFTGTDLSLPTKSANLFTAGFQARHTMGQVEPYGGISAGLFARVDDDSEGRRFSRNTFSFPFGLRIWISDHLGIRGEYRFREDNHEVVTYSNNETTVGLF